MSSVSSARERVSTVLMHGFQVILIVLVAIAAVGLDVSGWIAVASGRPWNWTWAAPLALAIVAAAAYGTALYIDLRAEKAEKASLATQSSGQQLAE